MKKNLFKPAMIFFRTFPTVILFELLFKLLLTALGAPVLTFLLKITMKISQVKYISDEHAWAYLRNPATIAALLFVLFFSAAFSFAELSALTACYSGVYTKQKTSVGGMFRIGIYSVKKVLRRDGIRTFLHFMILMPLLEFTLSSSVFMMPLLPMLKTLLKSWGSTAAVIVYIVLQAIIILLLISCCYSIHLHILTGKNLRDCIRESRRLMHGKKLKNAFWLIMWSLLIIAAAAVVTFVISFVVLLAIKGFSSPGKAFISALKALRYAGQIFSAVSAFLMAPVLTGGLTGRFFAETPEDIELSLPEISRTQVKTPVKAVIITAVLVGSFLLNVSYIKEIYKGNINLNVGILTPTQITAHRGASKIAPENTLYAFEEAMKSGADYIELDVQLTKDEELVVFHDRKINRVTNGKGNLSHYTYQELSKFRAAASFAGREEFEDARIPLLSEVFELTGDSILFNIEIKDYGNSSLTVEKTVALIQEYGLEDSCYITSFSYNVLKNVKKLDPQIKTGLIANAATTTAFAQLRYIDALSMNHLLVNSTVVNNAHQNGKRIFVWTVDSTADIQEMMALGVDNIITNRPDRAAEIIYSNSVSSKVITILRAIFN